MIGALQEWEIDYALTEMQKKAEQLVSNITAYTGLLPLDNLLTVKVEESAQKGLALRPAIDLAPCRWWIRLGLFFWCQKWFRDQKQNRYWDQRQSESLCDRWRCRSTYDDQYTFTYKKGQGAEKEFSLETQLRDADYYFNNQCDENGFKPFDTLLKPSINGNILTLPSVRQTPGKMENVILKIDFVQGKIISKTVNGSGENILS